MKASQTPEVTNKSQFSGSSEANKPRCQLPLLSECWTACEERGHMKET